MRARDDGRSATLTRAPEATPRAGLRLRLSRLPECARLPAPPAGLRPCTAALPQALAYVRPVRERRVGGVRSCTHASGPALHGAAPHISIKAGRFSVEQMSKEAIRFGSNSNSFGALPACVARRAHPRLRCPLATAAALHCAGIIRAVRTGRGAACKAEQWPTEHILPPERRPGADAPEAVRARPTVTP